MSVNFTNILNWESENFHGNFKSIKSLHFSKLRKLSKKKLKTWQKKNKSYEEKNQFYKIEKISWKKYLTTFWLARLPILTFLKRKNIFPALKRTKSIIWLVRIGVKYFFFLLILFSLVKFSCITFKNSPQK